MKTSPRLLALALSLCMTSGAAFAQVQIGQPGRLLASNCFECHGTNGRGPGFDGLAGKSSNELYQKLKDFQSGTGLMSTVAKGYSDSQLLAISNWFASQP
ncbi:c-type cytochrome [Thiomonas sp.]